MESNNLAYVSLIAGAAVWLIAFLHCVTFGLFTLVFFPLVFLASVVSVATGVLALQRAKTLDGLGKGPAMGGLALTGAYWVFALGLLALAVCGGGGLTFLSVLLGAAGG